MTLIYSYKLSRILKNSTRVKNFATISANRIFFIHWPKNTLSQTSKVHLFNSTFQPYIRFVFFFLNKLFFELISFFSKISTNYSVRYSDIHFSLYIWYNILTIFTCVTLGTPPRWLQQNGAVLSNKGNLAQSQNTHQYVQPAILSVLLIPWPSVCCTGIQPVCTIDNISIQFVVNRLLPANCCWMPNV